MVVETRSFEKIFSCCNVCEHKCSMFPSRDQFFDASARGADDDEDGLDGVDGDDVALSFAKQE